MAKTITVKITAEDTDVTVDVLSRVGTALSWYNDNCDEGEELTMVFA